MYNGKEFMPSIFLTSRKIELYLVPDFHVALHHNSDLTKFLNSLTRQLSAGSRKFLNSLIYDLLQVAENPKTNKWIRYEL